MRVSYSEINFPFPSKMHLRLNFLTVILVLWVVFFTIGLIGYTGSKVVYTLFSIVTSLMFITGIYQKSSYGYMFMTVFLWLGFWLKLTVHIILNYSFIEPVGLFAGGAKAWDEVLYVAMASSIGVMLGKIIYTLIKCKFGTLREDARPVIPLWYIKSRKLVWILLVVTTLTMFFINVKYGVQIIGLPPRTILMWPLNAIVTWFLNIGLATGVAVLLWWDLTLKKDISVPIYAILMEALFSSLCILSRSVYVFHAIPQLFSLYLLKKTLIGWSRFKAILLLFIFVLLLVISIAGVTTFRNYLYQSGTYLSTAGQVAYNELEVLQAEFKRLQLEYKNTGSFEARSRLMTIEARIKKLSVIIAQEKNRFNDAMVSNSPQTVILMNEFGYQLTGGFFTQILHLSVDRWIGLEGLMAVQSYPEKNLNLLWHGLSDRPTAGKPDIFQTIANSIYLKSDITKFKFAAIPGATAFLYYSDSILVVVFGMVFFTWVVLSFEFFINALTSNPILCSLYGVLMANNVTQLGVSPRQTIPYFLILTFGILLVWLIQTAFLNRLLNKFNFFRTTVT